MEDAIHHIEVLDEAQCFELLGQTEFGRLAVDLAGQPDIFPVNFIVSGGNLLFRTDAGTKLAGAALSHHVAFEADSVDAEAGTAWSVVIKGIAHLLERDEEIAEAQALPLKPWMPHLEPDFVRIVPNTVTGRRLQR